jgi:parallel beta-helix repeat protein
VVAGKRYYVDVNFGSDSNNGSSFEKPFKTLVAAIVASNANIALNSKGWAARNQIFFKGDNAEASKETLTTLPNKCDVIGVGSYDHRPFPMLIGNHVIGAGAYMGTRFVNMGFKSLAAGGAIFTVPTTTSGLQFIGCSFDGSTAVVATKGIVATAVEMLKIKGCRFIGAFSTDAIEIGAGESNGLLIEDNIIQSGAAGIVISSTMTCSVRDAIIRNNTFDVATITVNDASGKVLICGNRGRSAGNGKLASTLVFGTSMAVDNQFAHAAGNSIYPVQVAIVAP